MKGGKLNGSRFQGGNLMPTLYTITTGGEEDRAGDAVKSSIEEEKSPNRGPPKRGTTGTPTLNVWGICKLSD